MAIVAEANVQKMHGLCRLEAIGISERNSEDFQEKYLRTFTHPSLISSVTAPRLSATAKTNDSGTNKHYVQMYASTISSKIAT
jgi:hypothetical protein